MGHLFEKRKICHGCQGNYHSERNGVGGADPGKEEEKKKKVWQLLWTELDFGGILSLEDKQQQGPFSLSPSLFISSLFFIYSLSTFPLSQCLSVCIGSSLPHAAITSLQFFCSPSFRLFSLLSFCVPYAAAPLEITLWNLPPIRSPNPSIQPPAAHPWQLFRLLKRLMREAGSHSPIIGHY